MPRESQGSVQYVGSRNVSGGTEVWVEHADFPGWAFGVSFTDRAEAVGFELRPAIRQLSQEQEFEFFAGVSYSEGEALLWQAMLELPETAPPLTSRMLRRVPVFELQQAARHFEATMTDSWRGMLSGSPLGGLYPTEYRRWVDGVAESFRDQPRPGRAGRGDREYAVLAAAYVALLGDGREVVQLAETLCLSTTQVRSLLYEARRRELLTKAPPGHAGGSLTDKAMKLLTDEEA